MKRTWVARPNGVSLAYVWPIAERDPAAALAVLLALAYLSEPDLIRMEQAR